MKVVFYTDADEQLASMDLPQVPPDDTHVIIDTLSYRVAWSEWTICTAKYGCDTHDIVVNVFMVET